MRKKTMKTLMFLITIITFNLGLHSNDNTRYIELFSKTGLISDNQPADQTLNFFSDRNAVTRYKDVTINPILQNPEGLGAGDIININLFENKNYYGYIDLIDVNLNGTIAVRGKIEDFHYSYFTVSTTENLSLASISIPEKSEFYMVKPEVYSQNHYLLQMNQSLMSIINNESPMLSGDFIPNSNRYNRNFLNHGDKRDNEIVNVDLMIVYTPAAYNWAFYNAGGINNLISQSMQKASLTLENSNTLMTMTLVHSGEVDYIETGNPSVDLVRLTATPDYIPGGEEYYDGYYIPGFMEEIHDWRDLYGADLVALLADEPGAGGMAWLLSSTEGYPELAFSLTRVQQAHTSFTLIHELGHNMGAHHHKEQSFQPGPTLWFDWPENVWSAGWRWTVDDYGHFCTVMTYEQGYFYDDGIDHTAIAHFSNPDIVHYNIPTGHPLDGDNARTIRELRNVIADYRPGSDSPRNLTALHNNSIVETSWESPPEYQPLGYNIYRNGEMINTYLIEETFFADEHIEFNDLVTYHVTSVYAETESHPSNSAVLDLFFHSGSGNHEYPYQITSLEQLERIRNYLNTFDIYFLLVNDLDMLERSYSGKTLRQNETGWEPIGSGDDSSFMGHFDGGGFSISGLSINNADADNQALFGFIREASVSNINLSGVNINGRNNVGGLVGNSINSLITNCYVSGDLNGQQNVGGLVGHINSTLIEHSSFSGNINGVLNIGGIAGDGLSSSFPFVRISESSSNANITGENFVGGIIGRGVAINILQSYSSGKISSIGGVGGIAGFINTSLISNSYSVANIQGDNVVGGFVGLSHNSEINKSYSIGSVQGFENVGGFIGHNLNSNVLYSYWNLETSGQDNSSGGEGRQTIDMVYPHEENTYMNWDFVKLWSADTNHQFNYGYPYLTDITVDTAEESIALSRSDHLTTYPNPFNPVTNISYSIVNPGKIEISIYNIRGQKIDTLISEYHDSGNYSIKWNGTNNQKKTVSSGIYFVYMTTEERGYTRKIMLLK